MTPTLLYLLKVICVSGILYGYYLLALRNKVFHSWNRFYLLATILVSILLPLMEPHIVAPADNGSKVITALQVVAGADEYLQLPEKTSDSFWSTESLFNLLYVLVSLGTLFWLLKGLINIQQMIRRSPQKKMGNILFLLTREEGTPFSFFRYLFWHEDIDPASQNGVKILEHELVHIREKHSHDKLFVHLVLTVFWANPLFWLIRKELAMVHEFIADQQTVDDGASFAELILSATFPEHSNLLTNTFFHSSIKRRIDMITRNKNPRYLYISRLLLIPVLFLLLFTFGVKAKDMLSENPEKSLLIDKKVTVVIDPGHGGFDPGAVSGSAKEKDFNLELDPLASIIDTVPGKKVKTDTIRLPEGMDARGSIQSSDARIFINGKEMPKGVQINFVKADKIYIQTDSKGRESIFITKKDSTSIHPLYNEADKQLVATAIDTITIQTNSGTDRTSKNGTPIYLLDGKEISKAEMETIPSEKIQSVNVLKEKTAVQAYGNRGINGVVEIKLKDGQTVQNSATSSDGKVLGYAKSVQKKSSSEITTVTFSKNNAASDVVWPNKSIIEAVGNQSVQLLYILNGKEISEATMKEIPSETIGSITVLKGQAAEKKYGAKGLQGVMEIQQKK